MKLHFYPSGCGRDFEALGHWPEGWPCNIEYPDGSLDYIDPEVKFKAYETAQRELPWDRQLDGMGIEFRCEVRFLYDTTSLWCENVLIAFTAKDKHEAERLLQIAADALYGEERA